MLKKIAAGLAALTFLIHFLVGGADSLTPMLEAELPAAAEGAMHACWHIVSVFLLWSTVVFFRGGDAALHFAGIWIAAAAVFIYVGLVQDIPSGLVTNPQWTLLGVTGGMVIYDHLKAQKSSNDGSA